MSEQRTFVLDDGEEPTIVDLRVGRRARAVAQRDVSLPRWFGRANRVPFGAGVLLIVTLSIGFVGVVWRERQSSIAMRQMLEELRRNRALVSDVLRLESSAERLGRGGAPPRSERPHDEIRGGSRRELENRASAALSANDYGAALAFYRGLARLAPAEAVFSHLVAILEARVSCSHGREASGFSCR